MREEDKASAMKDISADDLLKLLHQQVDEGKPAKKTEKSAAPAAPKASAGGALAIDEDVYLSAKEGLLSADDPSMRDDSDLDLEALIDKFITAPAKKRADEAAAKAAAEAEIAAAEKAAAEKAAAEKAAAEKAAAEKAAAEAEAGTVEQPSEPIDIFSEFMVEEPVYTTDPPAGRHSDAQKPADIPEEPASAVREEEPEENLFDGIAGSDNPIAGTAAGLEEIFAGNELPAEEPAPAEEPVGEPTSEVEMPEPAEEDEDADMKIAAPAPLPVPEEDPIDGAATAVFDIAQVKRMVEPENEAEESADSADESQAFADAATEVFTPVHTDELADTSVTAQKVYGTPDGEEIDQTDLNLMIAFGMNEELKETVGEQAASEMTAEIEAQHEATAQMQAIKPMYEYTSRAQNLEILTRFRSQFYTLLFRIGAAAVILLALFFIENFKLLGYELPAFMRPGSYPVVYTMVNLQFVVLAGALVYRQLIDGVKNLAALKPTPESLTAFTLLMSLLYTLIALFTAPISGPELFNMPTAFAVLLALLYEFLNLKRDIFGFNVISSNRRKFIVTPVTGETENVEREVFQDYIPEDSQIIRVNRTDFVDGYFARIRDQKVSKPIIGILIPVIFILAAGFFILGYLKTQSVYEAFRLAFLCVTLTVPLTAFAVYSLPLYKASKDAYDHESAIIGESALGEYAGSAVISFEDKEVFPSGGVKVTSVKVYGNNRIDTILYNLASAFITVGGPLADVFSKVTHDMGHSENVELLSVEDDGFTVTVDETEVHIGKASYMEKQDFEPPFDAEDKRIEANGSVGILYIAYEGQLAAKVYVQYTIDGEFEKILAQLYKTGMCVGIKSFDPNIDDLLLAKKIKAMKYPVKVIRSRTVEDIPHGTDRSDSGIVSKKSVKTLLKTVALCERVSSVIKTGLIVKILGMLLGVVVMVFLYSFGSEITVSSLYLSLYQLFWIIPIVLLSHFMI